MVTTLLGVSSPAVHAQQAARRSDSDSVSRVHQEVASAYSGRAGQLGVHIPRIEARPPVDGTLSAPEWGHAALLTGFSEYKPVDGVPAEDSTEVLVWYAKDAIYFGIRAFELHGLPHATLAKRDEIDGDDNVQLILSPFLHSHQALVFAVNPYGVQEDGTITEGVGTMIGVGVSGGSGQDSTDLSSDFVYESKGKLTPFGYQVEVRIPFRSLKFPAKSPQDWGINVLRKVQHSGHSDTWYPAKLASSSYLDQAGTLVGIRDMDAGLVLDLNPIVTEQAVGNPTLGPAREWRYGVDRPQFGGNVRWGITSNLLLNGTYRPDFAEVESDATQIVSDPRNRTQYPEKRPFFLDGLEQFSAPNNLIYTRDIVAPIAATKLSGKVGDVSLAYLGAIDEEDENGLFGGHPSFNILRAREDFAQGSEIGAVITDKEAGGSFNRLASVDSRVTFATLYTLNLQAAGSSTRDAGVSTAGPLWQAGLNRAGRSVFLNYQITGIDPEFNAGSGLISRGGITVANLDSRYTFYPTHSALETFAIDVTWGYTWVYRDFTSFGAPEDRQVHPSLIATFHGGWQIIYTLGLSTFGYDPSIYTHYYLGHISAHDTTYTHYIGGQTLPNTDHDLFIATPTFAKFDLSLYNVYGNDDNFAEWSTAEIWYMHLALNYRPTRHLRAQLTYSGYTVWRHDDHSIVIKTLIPRLEADYQVSRPIFFRIVGQYSGNYQNSLRDDARTNLPVFLLNPTTGTYSRAVASQNNQLQLSGLFAYQPVPGTVAFVGYGNTMTEPDGFHFNPLRRVADNVFVKFSYLLPV
jgi:hypothetical protein